MQYYGVIWIWCDTGPFRKCFRVLVYWFQDFIFHVVLWQLGTLEPYSFTCVKFVNFSTDLFLQKNVTIKTCYIQFIKYISSSVTSRTGFVWYLKFSVTELKLRTFHFMHQNSSITCIWSLCIPVDSLCQSYQDFLDKGLLLTRNL